ncbi:hypothetical protein JW707_00255 [Candidatus Woesearchaeota archaeon]|nr:hypothetical protein [Candidatus Woesearchaeota archaeon]
MVDLTIVNYIRQLLQAGYDINSIKNRLITSGYDINTINEAVSYVYQASPREAPKPSPLDKFKSKKFLVAVGGIFGVIAIALLVLLFAGGEPAPIEMFLSPSSTQATQGGNLEFSKTLLNLEEAGMVSLGYELIDNFGAVVATKQESFSTQAVPPATTFPIGEEINPGTYTLKATARYGEQVAEAMFSFTVLEKIKEEPEEVIEEPIAGGPDNDNDGTPDETDIDDDNDGLLDTEDAYPLDHDNDGDPDITDNDDDNDGVLDKFDNYLYDMDNDGIIDLSDMDNDNDGIVNEEDTYPFDYDNDGVLDKDDDDTGRAYSLPAQQAAEVITSACAEDFDCNDFDICTADMCVAGTCEYERKEPCCGNFICEGDEDPATCPEDCREAEGPELPEQAEIDQLMQNAESNPESVAAKCSLFERTAATDECFDQLARKSGNSAFCSSIYDTKQKNTCYMYFVMSKNQFALCDQITDRYLQNSCFALSALKQTEAEVS